MVSSFNSLLLRSMLLWGRKSRSFALRHSTHLTRSCNYLSLTHDQHLPLIPFSTFFIRYFYSRFFSLFWNVKLEQGSQVATGNFHVVNSLSPKLDIQQMCVYVCVGLSSKLIFSLYLQAMNITVLSKVNLKILVTNGDVLPTILDCLHSARFSRSLIKEGRF